MKTKSITHNDVSEAMDELKDSTQKIVSSLVNISKTVNWKGIAGKALVALVLMYGFRNRKVLGTLVSTVVMGMMSPAVSGKAAQLKN